MAKYGKCFMSKSSLSLLCFWNQKYKLIWKLFQFLRSICFLFLPSITLPHSIKETQKYFYSSCCRGITQNGVFCAFFSIVGTDLICEAEFFL